ncbi:MAG TPA: ACP phosphodiesterase [Planctomycetota bacterium]|nr:ACP phosphodiesterase [Planctomycetota bacterium]
MNLLAHALLSGATPGVIVGGVMADWIKGPMDGGLPSEIADGVRRHRKTDAFIDAHPITSQLKRPLRDRWGRYSGVLVDMAYDFCLANDWKTFGSGTLEGFVGDVHGMIRRFLPLLPPSTAEVARHMITGEWILACRSWEGMGIALGRIAERLRRPVPLEKAVADLQPLETPILAGFRSVFPEVVHHLRS